MNKSKIANLFLGVAILLSVLLGIYWFIFIKGAGNSDEIHYQDEPVDEESQEVIENKESPETMQTENTESDDSAYDGSELSDEEFEPDDSQASVVEEKPIQDNTQRNNSSEDTRNMPDSFSELRNQFDDSLTYLISNGVESKIISLLDRLISYVKYSSENQEIVKSINAQSTLKNSFKNSDIFLMNNEVSQQVTIGQLISKKQNLNKDFHMKFSNLKLTPNNRRIESINVQIRLK